jgi:hypothetical protein
MSDVLGWFNFNWRSTRWMDAVTLIEVVAEKLGGGLAEV